jgi:hypothetical protein
MRWAFSSPFSREVETTLSPIPQGRLCLDSFDVLREGLVYDATQAMKRALRQRLRQSVSFHARFIAYIRRSAIRDSSISRP